MKKTTIGENLKRLRLARNLRQSDLEKLTGVSSEHISRIENGHNRGTYDTINKLAEGLEVPMSELVGDELINTGLDSRIQAMLDALDENARKFITEDDIKNLEDVLRLSIEMVKRLKK